MQPFISWSGSVSVFVIERAAIIHSLRCTMQFSFDLPLLSLAVTHCYLLSLLVLIVVTFCHLLQHSLSLVVTRCNTRLSFYKWSAISDKFIWDWILVFAFSVFFKNLFISKPWFLIRYDTVWRLMWPFYLR